jgi:hypothetical protein
VYAQARQASLRARDAALLIVVLLAFVWHGIVVQTHIHPVEAPAIAVHAASPGSIHQDRREDRSNDCPLCREVALSGAYVAPAAIALPVLVACRVWLAAAGPETRSRKTCSHAWQSRAPPIGSER